MIKTFLKNKEVYISQTKFGVFVYDIDVNRKLPREYFFDKKIAKEALLLIREVFNSVNLRFFLIFGTCLGAVREKDFIEHDTDIDLGIFKTDKIKLIQAIKELIEKYNFQVSKISVKEESITLTYKNIIIDIGLFKRKKKYYIYNDFYENKIPAKYLDTLEYLNFLGKDFYVPQNVEKYLTLLYGKNWKIPTKNWNYFNKYINVNIFNKLRKLKSYLKNFIKRGENVVYLILFKIGLHKNIFKQLGIKKIRLVTKKGQGFCDTFIIKANKNIVLKINNNSKFNYFKEDYKKVEPIYVFLEYEKRFLYEKELFERINKNKVIIIKDAIIFPFIEAKSLSSYLYKKEFFYYLKKSIEFLQYIKISHGDFHIDNILISNDGKIYLIDFEMIFSDYLTKEEQFYYDIYYFFAKLEYQYKEFFNKNYNEIKQFIYETFSNKERKKIINVADKTKKYFFSVNGARIDLFS